MPDDARRNSFCDSQSLADQISATQHKTGNSEIAQTQRCHFGCKNSKSNCLVFNKICQNFNIAHRSGPTRQSRLALIAAIPCRGSAVRPSQYIHLNVFGRSRCSSSGIGLAELGTKWNFSKSFAHALAVSRLLAPSIGGNGILPAREGGDVRFPPQDHGSFSPELMRLLGAGIATGCIPRSMAIF